MADAASREPGPVAQLRQDRGRQRRRVERADAAEAVEGQPPPSTDLVAEGDYVLKGNAMAASISLTVPGKGSQSCKA